MLTAHPVLSAALLRSGLCKIPEETEIPAALSALGLPALERAAGPTVPALAAEGAGAEG